MTTLVAIHTPGKGTFIGADTLTTAGHMRVGHIPKWFVHENGWAVASSGRWEIIYLLDRYGQQLLANMPDAHAFTARMKGLLRESEFEAGVEEPGPTEYGEFHILLANEHGVWDVSNTLLPFRIADNVLWGSGSGRELAIGAGHVLGQEREHPDAIVVRSVEASLSFDVFSGGEVYQHHLAVGSFTGKSAPKARATAKPRAKAKAKRPARKAISK